MIFTDEQKAAINVENGTLLVSAAAGSGKTAVLVERIYRLIMDDHRLKHMLIITFTNAAAAEMRARLNKRLREAVREDPERIGQALDDLECTQISTIHGFCQQVLRNEFQGVRIDPGARVAAKEEGKALFDRASRDALNALLAERDPQFEDFAAAFGVQNMLEFCGSLHEFLMSLPKPFEWLARKVEAARTEDMACHPWMEALRAYCVRQARGLLVDLEAYLDLSAAPEALPGMAVTAEKDRAALAPFVRAAEAGDAGAILAACGIKFPTSARVTSKTPEEEAVKNRWTSCRDDIKKQIGGLAKRFAFLLADPEKLRDDLRRVTGHLAGLARLTEETHRRFLDLKREERVIDFADMEQMTYDLLTDPSEPEYREIYQKAYRHIFVDECQDISQIQNDIIMAVHGPENSLFMVGDVKQSIYRFRQANPTLFLDRMRTYSREKDAAERAVFLQKNFRSTPAVLDAVNAVFARAMQRQVTEIDYTAEDALVPGGENTDTTPVEVHLIPEEGLNAREKAAAEADFAVRRIRKLLEEEKPGGGHWTYRDIAILMPRVANVGQQVAAALRDRGIPVYFDADGTYYEQAEVRAFKALLTLMDAPENDVALLAVLREPPFGFTDAMLAKIRLRRPEKGVSFGEALTDAAQTDTRLGARCRDALDTLAEWRFRLETSRLFDGLWELLRKSGLYARMGARKGGAERQANLRILCEKASEYEGRGGVALHGFLEQLEQEVSGGEAGSAHELGASENVVRLMTIHKSKGLEFPVVLCLQLSASIEKKRASDLAMHRDLGVCLPFVNREAGTKRAVPGSEAIARACAFDERAERCRLLYVAMTRARERLILSGVEKPDKACWRQAPGPERVEAADSMMDWVMQAVTDLQRAGVPSPFALTWEDPVEPETAEEPEDREISLPASGAEGGRLTWWDEPPRPVVYSALKTSVTSLVRPRPLQTEETEEDAALKRLPEILALRLGELPSHPAWMEERDTRGADYGISTHRFLSLVPLEELRLAGVGNRLPVLSRCREDLLAAGVLEKEEAGMIRLDRCAAFFDGELGQRLLASPRVKREWRFNWRMPDSPVLLQGVIDAAFREGDGWVLLDYKTDRITDEAAFVDHHREQLRWYARSVEAISGETVRECWLWSLSLSKAFPVALL